MIEGIIVFLINNEEFAVDLQQVPVITKAGNFFTDNPFIKDDEPVIEFDNKNIELVNINSELGLMNSELSTDSRIIIFERGMAYFGIIVDKIKFILNVDHQSLPKKESRNSDFIREIHYGNSVYRLINLNSISAKAS